MTGDQRICEGRLRKIICPDSGVVANESAFTQVELELLYGKEYVLNTFGKEEHYFFTPQGPVARSQVFFDWIVPHLPSSFETLIEIGCGEGNLLSRFSKQFPTKDILGFDGSYEASRLAKKKGLNVKQGLFVENEPLPKADVFLLVNVAEHVEDIQSLISSLKGALADNGRIIFCLPIQDYGGYDIFFAEHVWHFTADHFKTILRNNGLKLLYSDVNHPVNHGVGLFVCEKTDNELMVTAPSYSGTIKKNLECWENKFMALDILLDSADFQRIALFGAGEVSTLFLTFTSLGERNVVACIDDTKNPGCTKHGIPVFQSTWLDKNEVDLLLLAVNKKYHDGVSAKLQRYNLNIHPIY